MTVEDAMQHKFFDGIKNEHLRKLKFPQWLLKISANFGF